MKRIPFKNFREFLEAHLIMPMTAILIGAFMVRSSQTWSLGAIRLSALPGPVTTALNMATGVAMAFAMETLTVAALSVSLTRYYRMKDLETSGDLRKAEKKPLLTKLGMQVRLYAGFGVFGALCSTVAIVSYAVSANLGGDMLLDVAVALAMQVGLIYFGVLHEREPADPVKENTHLALQELGSVAKRLGEKLASGNYEDADVRTFQRMIPAEMRRQLEPLVKGVADAEMWTVAKIASFLCRSHEEMALAAMQRRVRRVLCQHAHESSYGITMKRNSYLVPAPSVFTLFQSEIEALTLPGQAPDMSRTFTYPDPAPVLARTSVQADIVRTL